jgi:hypothetical protein
MESKHATVVVLTFVLVGLMFFSIDTPLAVQQEVDTEIHEGPEIVEQIAEGPVPQEPLRLNVISNPSFEEWNSIDDVPMDWQVQTSAYQFGDLAYTEEVANGTYAGYVEGQGGPGASASAYITTGNIPPATNDLLEPGLSLSFYWNALAVPDLQLGSEVYLRLQTNGLLGFRYLYYHLCTGSTSYSNDDRNFHTIVNDTTNQWNSFDRNITEDFIAAFGLPQLTTTEYVSNLYFYATSPAGATDIVRLVFDDVSLYNGTFTEFLSNGDFETGTGSSWFTYQSTLGYVEQSPDSTVDSYSVNITAPQVSIGSGWARCYRYLGPTGYYYALTPGMTMIRTDWKYNDTVSAGAGQYAYLRLTFQNVTQYQVHYYFGIGDDTIHQANDTLNYYVKVPGFGVRDSWQTTEFDLYDAVSQIGLDSLPLTQLSFYVYEAQPSSTVELLIDNFNLVTYPVGEPGFEYDTPIGVTSPHLGWTASGPTYDVFSKTTDAHGGTYANNMTAFDDQDVYVYREGMGFDFDAGLFTDFWWRLDDVTPGDTGYSSSYIQLKFSASGQSRYVRYMLANNEFWIPTDISSTKYFYADGFNQTGVWTRLHRNITADIVTKFSVDPTDWTLEDVQMWTSAGIGLRTSIIFDDMNFIDAIPPIVNSVSFDATPMYYEDVSVRISTTDARPGVSNVFVLYSVDSWSSSEVSVGVYDEGDWYNATIPAQPYDTQVEFYIQVTDGCGIEKIDDNGGFYYSYTVGDDIDPTLTITNPLNNTDQSGLLTITADVDDSGSGIEWVSFNADGSGSITDYDAPYQQNWNLDDETLGSHFVIVTVRDNVGHEVTKTHHFTVVDTDDPVLDSPTDVQFDEGDPGHSIDWNPTDARPTSYEVFVDEISTYTGTWNESSEHVVISLDGLAVGVYNYTCVVYDEAGNYAADTVMVTVNEVAITTTSDTTTTASGSTDTDTETTTGPTGGGDLLSPILIVGIIGVVGIVLIVFVVLPKMKKS